MKMPSAKSRWFPKGKGGKRAAKAWQRYVEMPFFPCNAAIWKQAALQRAVL